MYHNLLNLLVLVAFPYLTQNSSSIHYTANISACTFVDQHCPQLQVFDFTLAVVCIQVASLLLCTA